MPEIQEVKSQFVVPFAGLPEEAAPLERARTERSVRGVPASQAFRILQGGFIAAPTIAGADKFFHALTNWDQYLAPQIARRLPVSPHTFMLGVGVVEVAAGLLVAAKPKWGGYVVGAWLGGIVANLLLSRRFLDVALRDVGLMLGAFALARLAGAHEEQLA